MITRPQFTIVLAGTLALAQFACTDGAKDDKAEQDDKADAKKSEERPKRELPTADLPEPTAEELAAWDRKDPEGEKHLYKWDKANSKKMHTYWKELRCLRDKMKEEGEKAFGTEPGGTEQQQWDQFKAAFVMMVVNPWQQKLFAAEGMDVLSKSKFMGNILEAHELVMNGYPTAYNTSDRTEVTVQDARWTVVENKIVDYSDKIGAPIKLPDLDDPKQAQNWEKFCKDVVLPPKPKKKKK
jgi:hypothetical protein